MDLPILDAHISGIIICGLQLPLPSEDSVLWAHPSEACVSSPSSVWLLRVSGLSRCVSIHLSEDIWAVSALAIRKQCCCGHVPGVCEGGEPWSSCYLPGTGLWVLQILCLTVEVLLTAPVTAPARPPRCAGSQFPHPTSACYIHPCPGHPGGCEESPPGILSGVAYPYSHPGDLYGFRPSGSTLPGQQGEPSLPRVKVWIASPLPRGPAGARV